MEEQRRIFWAPYIAVIGEENFQLDGMIIKSKFFCGLDISLSEDAEKYAEKQRDAIIERSRTYTDIMKKVSLSVDDLRLIFSSLIEKQYFDEEFLYLIRNKTLDVSDEEYWKQVIKLWTRQEFTTSGNRRKNWLEIFKFRPRTASMTAELPESFKAFRAGKLDGFSWTLNEDTARWFQERFKYQFGEVPFHEKLFKREDALFFVNDRNEQEIVILSKKYRT